MHSVFYSCRLCIIISLWFCVFLHISVDILLQQSNLDCNCSYSYFNTKTWSLLLNIIFDPNNYPENDCIEFY